MNNYSSETQSKRSRIRWTASRSERFWSKVDRSGEHWLWCGAISSNGYGSFMWSPGKMVGAHVAAVLLDGTLGPGQVVMHDCDIKLCVRHVRAATQSENTKDMYDKGRQAKSRHGYPRGEDNHASKLTERTVRRVKKLLHKGTPKREIAEMTGVSIYNVRNIYSGRSWAHVEV